MTFCLPKYLYILIIRLYTEYLTKPTMTTLHTQSLKYFTLIKTIALLHLFLYKYVNQFNLSRLKCTFSEWSIRGEETWSTRSSPVTSTLSLLFGIFRTLHRKLCHLAFSANQTKKKSIILNYSTLRCCVMKSLCTNSK